MEAVQHALSVAMGSGSDAQHLAELRGKLSAAHSALDRARDQAR